MSSFTSHYDPDVDQIRAVLVAMHSQGEGDWPAHAADALAALERILLSRRNAICTVRRLREVRVLREPLRMGSESWSDDTPF